MNSEQLQQIIISRLEDAEVKVAGEGGKFEVMVTSKIFDGLGTVERHRLVYEAVSDEIRDGTIHALSIQTRVDETG